MVTIKGDAARAQKLLSDLEHVDHVTMQQSEEEGTALLSVTAKGREDIREDISLSLSKAGIIIFAMKENTQSLEDVFIELTERRRTKNNACNFLNVNSNPYSEYNWMVIYWDNIGFVWSVFFCI